jgi:hypothetical protein
MIVIVLIVAVGIAAVYSFKDTYLVRNAMGLAMLRLRNQTDSDLYQTVVTFRTSESNGALNTWHCGTIESGAFVEKRLVGVGDVYPIEITYRTSQGTETQQCDGYAGRGDILEIVVAEGNKMTFHYAKE